MIIAVSLKERKQERIPPPPPERERDREESVRNVCMYVLL